MKRLGFCGLALIMALAVLVGGCQKSLEERIEEVMSGKTHELPPTVSLATEPAPVKVGEVMLKATVTDPDGKPLGEKARVRFLYWKAYEKAPTAPEEFVREAPGAVREGDRIYRTKVKLDKSGEWKVAVKVERPQGGRLEREPTAATFTLDVRG